MHFVAELTFLSTDERGRHSPANSGYRPHIEFEGYPNYLTSGDQRYIEKHQVYPGEVVEARITILSRDYFVNKLWLGQKFKFSEGPNLIGNGIIRSFEDKALIKSTKL